MRDWVADLNEDIRPLGWSKEDLELIIERVADDAEEAERAFYHIHSQRDRLKKILKSYQKLAR